MTRPHFLCLLALATALCGCITKHAGVPESKIDWTVGRTTRQQVVARWGNPDKIKGETWIWRDWNLTGGKFKAAYMMIGITVSNTAASTREHWLTFDDDGKLLRHETVDSVPGGATWSIWPW